jgi:hypothetical protein
MYTRLPEVHCPRVAVLPGPEIVFRPVHQKYSANFTKTSLQPLAKESIKK